MAREHADHFESLEVQAHAAKLGMWIFLASEILLFAGLFTLFLAARAHDGASFHEAVRHNTKTLGSINTAVLLVSSTIVALAVHWVRAGRRRAATIALVVTMLFGAAFLAIKFAEYAHHFHEGIYPGAGGAYFDAAHAGEAPFWTLYFVMTGLHAIHVTVGIVILGFTAHGIWKGKIDGERPHRAENGALYWHLIDLIWIFLWPLLYLA